MPESIDVRNHHVKLKSSFGDQVAIYRMTGHEELGRLFEIELELFSTNPDIAFADIVGKRVTIELMLEDGTRYFDGFVTEFRYTGGVDEYFLYEAVVRPWLWLLTHTSDCRVFQKEVDGVETVPDIIKAVFRDNEMFDFEERLRGEYRNWEYCVQYRESDFAFVSRLMEQEGIYYWFEHEDGKHTMVLADDASAFKKFPGAPATVPYRPAHGSRIHREEHIETLSAAHEIRPHQASLNEYNFEKSKVPLEAKLSNALDHPPPVPKAEIYDYPGEYSEQGEGDVYVKHRLQELQSQHERIHCSGPVRTLATGCEFTLDEHPRGELNTTFLVSAMRHVIKGMDIYGAGPDASDVYVCDVEAFDKNLPFRPARITPKPVVHGCQTAVVVGPAGEEIHCNEHGEVKVQFHWDRYGKKDENSSCWMRVSQPWAGKGWGAMWIPRIGQEVIVSFLEGDADQPIITGRVYNDDQTPPYGLPGNKTQSGFKSNSSPGGGGWNEIRFEDKAGSEQVHIHSQKDLDYQTNNNKTENVGVNETITIGSDRQETVGANETINIGANRVETVAGDETLSVGGNRIRNVAATETVTVTGARTHTVAASETINIASVQAVTIGAAMNLAVGGAQAVEVGGAQAIEVGGLRSVSVAGWQSTEVGASWSVDVGSKLTVEAGGDVKFTAGTDVEIDAGSSLTLKCGAASITLKGGNVTIKGSGITFKSSGSITGKAGGSVAIKGATVKEN